MTFFDGIPSINGVPQIPLNGKYEIHQARLTDGTLSPVLSALTSGGLAYFYLPPHLADGIAGALTKCAAASRAGLLFDPDAAPPPEPGLTPGGRLLRGN